MTRPNETSEVDENAATGETPSASDAPTDPAFTAIIQSIMAAPSMATIATARPRRIMTRAEVMTHPLASRFTRLVEKEGYIVEVFHSEYDLRRAASQVMGSGYYEIADIPKQRWYICYKPT